MSNNDTRENGSTLMKDETYWELLVTTESIVIVLSLATLFCGVTSWLIIKEFRNYRNYVFMNAIFANFLFYSTELGFQMYDNVMLVPKTIFVLLFYLLSVKNHWLLVICHMFYVDLVKVFGGDIHRRNLKCVLFAWIVSFISFTIFIIISYYCIKTSIIFLDPANDIGVINIICIFFCASSLLPLITNLCFYIVIVCSLFRSFNTSTQTASKIWRRLYVATLIFILSDLILLSGCFLTMTFPRVHATGVPPLLRLLTNHFNAFALPILMVIIKSNRKKWHEFYLKKFNQQSLSTGHGHSGNTHGETSC